jgi:hypothetical protein
MKRLLILVAIATSLVMPARAQVVGGGGSGNLVGGTTPVSGTCANGNFMYNNSGILGCSSSSATIALPQALTGGVQGGVPWFSATTTMSASGLLANGALMIGGGTGAAPSTITTGTGVTTALGVNVGSAGAFVVNGGALGTPSGGTATNLTGLPISTGVSGLGTGVATALAAATNGAGGIDTVDGTATLSNKTINTPTFAVTGTPAWSLDANSTLYPRVTLATNMTTGFLNIPGAAGVPSGVPANTTGIPLYWNTSTNSLYGYNAGWQAISGGGGGSLTIGTTSIASGTTGRILYDNAAVVGEALLTYSPANFQLGAADAAAPVAQTLQVQNVVAGTTNTAGTNFTINGSRGTGTGVGGSLIFQVAPAGTTGSSQNALATALTIASDKGTTFGGNATLYGDAANTLAQRNSTNAQTFNVYNTYTDASNYERGVFKWSSNVLQIGVEFAGTGVARSLAIPTNGAASIPALALTGTPFSGGNGTTTKPQLLVEPTGATSTGWNTAGTLIGANGNAAFQTGSGSYLGLFNNGARVLEVQVDGGGKTKFIGANAGLNFRTSSTNSFQFSAANEAAAVCRINSLV